MQLRARPARAGIAHLPKIVLHPKRHHPLGRKKLLPDLFRFKVRLEPGFFVASKVRRIKPRRIKPEAPVLSGPGHQLPRPRDRLSLEIIPERPVAEHLEEGMVIGVLAHIIEVVVLAARADALLGIGRALEPLQRRVGIERAQKDRLILIHPRVGKGITKRRIVRRAGRR